MLQSLLTSDSAFVIYPPGAQINREITSVAINNDPTELEIVTNALEELGVRAAVPRPTLIQLQVVLDEVLSNVIKYAWPEGGSHALHVDIAVEDSFIQIDISDDGRPFDPRAQPLPQPPPPGQRPKPGGVGIHMVKQMVDDFSYSRIDGRNQVTLKKRF